jgi:hypothetical protein
MTICIFYRHVVPDGTRAAESSEHDCSQYIVCGSEKRKEKKEERRVGESMPAPIY